MVIFAVHGRMGAGNRARPCLPSYTEAPICDRRHDRASPATRAATRGSPSTFLALKRDVIVYLPPGYDDDANPCPVFYMHDGQNLFDPATAHVPGQHWRVGETVDALIAAGILPPLIVVGIANTGTSRIHEYTPTARRAPGRRAGRTTTDASWSRS